MAVTSVQLSVVVWGFAACTLSFFTPLWLLMKVHPVLSGQAWPHVYVIMWKMAVWTCRNSTQQAATPSRLQPLIWFRVQSILESNPPLTPTFSTGRIHWLNKPNLQCTACLVVHCKKPGDTIQNVWQCIFFFSSQPGAEHSGEIWNVLSGTVTLHGLSPCLAIETIILAFHIGPAWPWPRSDVFHSILY